MQTEMLAIFATITVNVEQVHVLPLPPQSRRRPTMGKILRTVSRPEGAVHQGNGSRSRARIASKELARTHRVIHDILPCAQITHLKQAASLEKSVRS